MADIPDTRLGAFPNLTYGHLFGEPKDLPHLEGTGRSGLSPTFFSGPNEPLFPTDATLPLYEAERIYQKMKLAGYTSSLLHAMGALEKPNVKTPNLANELHPLFDKPMWAPAGTVPIEGGLRGDYVVYNDVVWNAMLPSLRLASKILENVHCWPWWDALIYGEYKLIPSPPGTAARPRMSFHTRPPEVVLAEGFTADENFINRFRTRVRYLINIANSEWDNAETGTVIHASTMGYTQYLPNFDISRITLASQVIGPLLREDISDSQRLVMQFQLAKTILHEFAHAIGFLLRVDDDLLEYDEPFFEDQIVAELGESMETAVCGGRIWSFPSSLSQRAYMVTTVQNWPNYVVMSEKEGLGLGRQLLPGSGSAFGPGSEQNVMAIPISWMESLFQDDFWSVYVRQFGADAIRPYPRLIIQSSVIATLDRRTGVVTRKAVTKFGEDYNTYMASKYSPDVEMGGTEVASLAHRMDGERFREMCRQCAVLEQAMAWYWSRTGVYGEA